MLAISGPHIILSIDVVNYAQNFGSIKPEPIKIMETLKSLNVYWHIFKRWAGIS